MPDFIPGAVCRNPARSVLGPLLLLLAVACWPALPAAAQDPAAQRLFEEARRLDEGGDPAAALEEYQLLVQQFPQDRLAAKALLQVVELRHAKGDESGTRSALQRLLADYPRRLESASAFILQAEIESDGANDAADLEEARKTFRRVPLLYGPETFPQLVDRTRARIRSGEISLLLGDDDAAAAEFLAAIEDEPPSPWTGRARLRLGTALLRGGEWAAAAEILQRLASETEPEPGEGTNAVVATSAEADRIRARRLLTFLHRHVLRPLAGERRWQTTSRYPTAGLQLREPSGVAAGDDGRALIVDRRAQVIALLEADGRVAESRQLRDAARPGWSQAGGPFVVTETALVLPFAGQQTSFLEPRPGRENPLKGMLAAERGLFGRWFILAKGWRSLLSFENRRKGQELLATSKPELEDLARGPRGHIYVLDEKAKHVGRLGIDQRWEGAVVRGSHWRRPVAVTVDFLGQIYVLDRGTKTIEVYEADGKRLLTLGPVLTGGIELRAPVDLAVDGTGRLFIADNKLPFIVVLE